MQSRNVFSKAFGFVLLIGALVAIASIWYATRVRAFNPQPDPPALGAFGITHEQTIRLNARVFVPESNSIPNERLSPVVIEFDFHDAENNLIRSIVQTVAPGHSAFLDLNGGEVAGSAANRSEYQPCVKVLQNPNRENRVQIITSLEVFDNFGPDAGKTRMGVSPNHNETLVRDTARSNLARR